jgi:hypothetical protein
MKTPEYTEGPEALANFKRGMKALFKVPKTAVIVQAKKNNPKPVSSMKTKRADRD